LARKKRARAINPIKTKVTKEAKTAKPITAGCSKGEYSQMSSEQGTEVSDTKRD
jgi:hypothetical protein